MGLPSWATDEWINSVGFSPTSKPEMPKIETEKPVVSFAKPMMPAKKSGPEWATDDWLKSVQFGPQAETPIPPPPERGVLGDIASTLARGVAVGVPQTAGGLVSGLGALTGIEPLKTTGRAIQEFAQELPEDYPFLQPSRREVESPVWRAITGAVEMAPTLIGLGGPIGVATNLGAKALSLSPKIGSILGHLVGLGGTFGLAGKGQAYEEALSQGLPEEEAQSFSSKIGAIESLVWGSLHPIHMGAAAISKAVFPRTAKSTIRALLTPTKKESLLALGQTMPPMVGAGMASAALQAGAREEYGLPTEEAEEAALHSILPTIAISAMFGIGTRGMAWKDRQAIFTSLRNPTIDPAFRNRAADAVYKNLHGVDPEVAEMWRREAGYRIQGRREIPIDEDYMAWIRSGQSERLPAIWGTPGARLPVPYEEPAAMARGPISQESPRLLTTRLPEEIRFGEGFVMAEPWIVHGRGKIYELPGREAATLLPGREKPIPQLPFYPPPAGTTLGEGFIAKGPVQPKIYAKIAEDAYKEVIRMGEDGRPILGDTVYKRSQIVPKEATVKTGKGRIAPEVGVTSAGVLPTERPSPPAPGAFYHGTSDINTAKIMAGEVIEARYASHKDYPGFYITSSKPLAETYGKQAAGRGGNPTLLEIGIKDGARVIMEKDLIQRSGLTGKVSEMAEARAKWAADNGYDIIGRANGEFVVLNQKVMEVRGAPSEVPQKPKEGPPPGEKAIPPTVTPPQVEKPQIPQAPPLGEPQMEAIRSQAKQLGGTGIAMVQRIASTTGEKISVPKAKEVLDYLVATGEIEPQVGGGAAMFPYTVTGKIPEKPVVQLPEGITKYKKTHGYMKTDTGWEVWGPEGKIEVAKSRDQARAIIDKIKAGGEKPPAAGPIPPPPGLAEELTKPFREIDVTKIPEGEKIKITAIREKTGKPVEVEINAREAITEHKSKLDLFKSFLECVMT